MEFTLSIFPYYLTVIGGELVVSTTHRIVTVIKIRFDVLIPVISMDHRHRLK